MKFAEINRKFTEKVAGYIGAGWTVNTGTMSGTQGEVAKVDLTDGNRIVRVKMNKVSNNYRYGFEISVGYAKPKSIPNSFNTWQTIWDRELDIVSHEVFYQPNMDNSVDWFVTEEESIACAEKMWGRYHSRYMGSASKDLTERCAPVVLSFVKRQPKCKSAKLADVTVIREANGKYRVRYKDRSWTLK